MCYLEKVFKQAVNCTTNWKKTTQTGLHECIKLLKLRNVTS